MGNLSSLYRQASGNPARRMGATHLWLAEMDSHQAFYRRGSQRNPAMPDWGPMVTTTMLRRISYSRILVTIRR
ncbi:hypothetical protein [Corynebacterium lactis]|nr:hypothetical protein [Corynebacterium lactis]